MRHAIRQPTTDPITDLAMMVWGVVVSWMQWLDLATLNEGLGAAVAALTIILLLYRITLAHEEVTEGQEVTEQ